VIRRAVEEGHAERSALDGLAQKIERAMWRPEYRPLKFGVTGTT
jgi:hypothetical protein